MATTAVRPGAALGAATQGLRHQQLSTRSEAPQPRAPVAAGRASPEQLDDRTAGSTRIPAPDQRTGAG
jgi:hypothetical protein